MTTWIKKDGSSIELNDAKATVDQAGKLGWKKKRKSIPKKSTTK